MSNEGEPTRPLSSQLHYPTDVPDSQVLPAHMSSPTLAAHLSKVLANAPPIAIQNNQPDGTLAASASGAATHQMHLTGVDLVSVISAIADACMHIASKLRFHMVQKHQAQKNEFGDEVLSIDLLADEFIRKRLVEEAAVASISSEEHPKLQVLRAGDQGGLCHVSYDPLDGSSVIDSNLAVSSIFAVWPGCTPIGMRAGDMVASVICVYGPRCTLFVSVKGGACYEYMLHDWAGREQQFGLVRRKPCALAPRAQIFAPANLRAASVDAGYLRFVQEAIKRKWTLRYSGALAPDCAQLLVKGNGIFSTPAIAPFTVKLRMCFEVAPIALMIVCAGGAARCGSGAFGDVLDERITSLDQRASIICGSKDSVAELVQMLQESSKSSSKQGAAPKVSSKL